MPLPGPTPATDSLSSLITNGIAVASGCGTVLVWLGTSPDLPGPIRLAGLVAATLVALAFTGLVLNWRRSVAAGPVQSAPPESALPDGVLRFPGLA